jgi:hypothetical protein
MTNVPEKSPKFDQIKTRIVLDKQGPDLSLFTKPIYRRILSLNLIIEKKKKNQFFTKKQILNFLNDSTPAIEI